MKNGNINCLVGLPKTASKWNLPVFEIKNRICLGRLKLLHC
jgi:hypothetical protein